MDSADIESVLSVLEAMADAELAVAEFYGACSRTWESEQGFFAALSRDEMRHAADVRALARILADKPEQFQSLRHFHKAAVQTFVAGVKESAARVHRGETPLERVLHVALDMEKSILESRFTEIVKTEEIEYQTLARRIMDETRAHKANIERRITGRMKDRSN